MWWWCGAGEVLAAGSREQVVNVGEIEKCGDVGGYFVYMSCFIFL